MNIYNFPRIIKCEATPAHYLFGTVAVIEPYSHRRQLTYDRW
jgi:hypothetical protein